MPESKRKLAAILSADVVGYSRLMGADEEATVSALNDCRAIFKTRIAEHHGRVVDTAGDSVLAEFPSVVEAVRTAVEVQDALARRNEVLSEDRRMLFRIGVNLDDVIEQADGSIYGGGVNVAARLEALAEPGGICVSASAFERVKGKLDQGFEPMGTHEVKNIAEPVQVFRVTPGDAKTQSAGFRGAHEPTHKAPLRGAPTTQRPSSGVKDTRPSIVILPFQNRSRDEEDEYFTDGVTEDVISTLGKLEGLRVIPRASAFQFKGKRPALHELVQLLRVTHVLEGSVRRAGVRLRITVELIETAKGDQVWTERYDRVMADIFDIQDEISQAIAQALKAKLTGATSSAARVHRTENLAAYRLYLKGRQHLYAFSRAAFRQATSCFENALEHDTQYPEPHSGLADAYSLLGILGFVRPQEVMPKAKAEALRALELDETIAEAHTSLALVQFSYDWDFAGAEQSFRRAIELDPAAPTCRVFFGWFLVVCGRSGEGVAEHRTGVDLDPLSPFVNRMLALALLMARDYEAVLEQVRTTLEIEPSYFPARWDEAAAHYKLGRPDEALRAIEAAHNLAPQDPTTLGRLGAFQALAGRAEDALRTIEQLKTMRSQRHVGAFVISWPYLQLGDLDHAFEWLETALEERDGLLWLIKRHPLCEAWAKDEPRYQDVLRRIGFPE